MESRKRKRISVPLPYMIPPSKNDGLGYENDDEDSCMEAVETSSSVKGHYSSLGNESNASLSEMDVSSGHSVSDEKDEEYVVVDNVEALTDSNTGAIQMMELSKVDESESEDAVPNIDDWVVV